MSSASPLRLLIQRWRLTVALVAGACVVGGVAGVLLDANSPTEAVVRPTLTSENANDAVPTPAPASAPIAPAAPVAKSGGDTSVALSGLVLYGTIARDDPTAGYALLGSTPQNSSLYGSGVEVVRGVLLREIYPNRVVLVRNGVVLVLPIASSSGGGVQPGLEAARLDGPAPPLPAAADTLRAGATDDERMPGIRVYPGRNHGAFAQLGLHPGDLVTAINGQPVTGPDVIDLQQMLKDLGTATVTVFRAGRLQQLSVQSADTEDGGDPDGDGP